MRATLLAAMVVIGFGCGDPKDAPPGPLPCSGDLDFVAPCSPEFAWASARDGAGICYRHVDQETGIASDPVTGCTAKAIACVSYCY